jgi:hypothetical protein
MGLTNPIGWYYFRMQCRVKCKFDSYTVDCYSVITVLLQPITDYYSLSLDRNRSLIKILNVVGLGVNFVTLSSFHIFGKAK